jgi:gluconolactonase
MWKLIALIALAGACGSSSVGTDNNTNPDAGSGGTDAAMDAPAGPPTSPLIGIGAVTQVPPAAMPFQFLEGPQWRQASGDWLFTDIPANRIYRYAPGGNVTPFLEPSGMANGLALDGAGVLLAAEHGGRRISRVVGTTVTAVAERFDGKLFNSPNDLVVAADGTIYFTDPPYGLAGRPAELAFNGVFRIAPDGTVTAERQGVAAERPNGIALSPDGKKVYVAFTNSGEVLAFAVMANGSLGPGVRAALTSGGADGMAVDESGNLFVTANGSNGAKGSIDVFAPDGTKWGQIELPAKPTNCAFGGADRRTLLMTTPTALYQVTLAKPGFPTK